MHVISYVFFVYVLFTKVFMQPFDGLIYAKKKKKLWM